MNIDKIASTHLGKNSAGSEVYNPALLVAVPRAENRKQYGINAAMNEDWRLGRQEGKQKSAPTLHSPMGMVSGGQEGICPEDRKAGGQEDRLLSVESGKLKVESLLSNNSEILQEQQTDNSCSSLPLKTAFQPFNPSTNNPSPHPNPLPLGEGALKADCSTQNSLPSCLSGLEPSNTAPSLQTSPVGVGAVLPFFGYDVWHAYEFSCMTENGVPVTRVMKMKYSCNNEFLVESKSLKLYLNSFNMMKFGNNTHECLEICKKMIEKDLSELLKTTVEINFLDKSAKQAKIFEDFENIMDFVDETAIQITDFKENPEILQVEDAQEREYKLTFDSLRSNCRVTHQPDFGDAFIYYRSKKHIKEDSLVKYLTSFRSEYHFHEECCEMIFKRLSDILDEEDELMVCALYTRRGGIDICPVRWRNAAKQLGSQAARFNNNDMDSSQFTVHGSHDTVLSPYRPIALSPCYNAIKALLNTQTLARNGIKQ